MQQAVNTVWQLRALLGMVPGLSGRAAALGSPSDADVMAHLEKCTEDMIREHETVVRELTNQIRGSTGVQMGGAESGVVEELPGQFDPSTGWRQIVVQPASFQGVLRFKWLSP